MGIWEDTPQEPVKPAEPVVEARAEAVAEVKPNEFVGLPVRAGDDRIWLLKGGKRHWITNAEVYSKLGFKFGDERKIDQETLSVLTEGEPVR